MYRKTSRYSNRVATIPGNIYMLLHFAFKYGARILIAFHIIRIEMLLHEGLFKLEGADKQAKIQLAGSRVKYRQTDIRLGFYVFYQRAGINNRLFWHFYTGYKLPPICLGIIRANKRMQINFIIKHEKFR